MAGFVRIILLLVGIAIQLEYVHSQNPMHSKGTFMIVFTNLLLKAVFVR